MKGKPVLGRAHADYCPLCLIRMGQEKWPAWGRPVICNPHGAELERQYPDVLSYFRACEALRALATRRQTGAYTEWALEVARWQATAALDKKAASGPAQEAG